MITFIKKYKLVFVFFLVCIILFQFFAAGSVIFFHDELFFDTSIKPLSYEYWTWLITYSVINFKLVDIVNGVYYAMTAVCFFGFLLVLSSDEFAHKMKKRHILAVFLSGYMVYVICKLLIRYFSPDYRVYMILIPSEILSLRLLFFIVKALRKKKTPGE